MVSFESFACLAVTVCFLVDFNQSSVGQNENGGTGADVGVVSGN